MQTLYLKGRELVAMDGLEPSTSALWKLWS